MKIINNGNRKKLKCLYCEEKKSCESFKGMEKIQNFYIKDIIDYIREFKILPNNICSNCIKNLEKNKLLEEFYGEFFMIDEEKLILENYKVPSINLFIKKLKEVKQ